MIDPISWEYAWPYMLAALAGGYLLGSIPFGLLLTRYAGLGDIRKVGSGNIGATNVLRTGRKGLAAATLLLDLAKGAAAVLLGNMYGPDAAIVAGAGAMLGHVFPVWLKFRGGKGVATALGILLALAWPVALAAGATWAAVFAAFRISSLSAIVAAVAAPIYAYWLSVPQKAEFVIFIAAVILLRHTGNIARLLRGEETKFGRKKAD